MSLNATQYSNLRQSLRQMPPTNPPLPKDNAQQNRVSPSLWPFPTLHDPSLTSSQGTRHLRDLLQRKGVKNIAKTMGRRKVKSGGGKREGKSSDHSGSSSLGTGSSSSGTNHSYSDSIQCSSSSEHSFHQQEDRGLTSLYDDGNGFGEHIFDAEVSRDYSGNDDFTFDCDYAKQRCTFDYDYTQHYEGRETNNHLPPWQQPQTLPTLQQHLTKKREHYRDPRMQPDDESRVDVLDSAQSMDHTMQELGQKSSSIQQPQTMSQPTKTPSERYANRKSSIDNNVDPTLINDIIRGAKEGGEKVSTVSMLHEMGLRSKSQRPLPDWVDDVLGYDLESIDPEVLKELVVATVGGDDSPRNDDISGIDPEVLKELVVATVGGDDSSRKNAVSGELQSDFDFMVWARQDNATAADYGKITMIDQRQPLGHVKTEKNHDDQRKSWPSAVAQDTRGPIPTTDILGSSFSSMVEPHRLLNVVEDARGPIPADDIIDCAISASSDYKGGSVGSSSYGVQKDSESASSVSRTLAKGGSLGSSSYDAKKDEETASIQRSYNKGGSVDSSSYGARKDVDRASVSITSYNSSYSDRKPPPPINLSPQSTVQSSHNQSTYYTRGRQSTIEYPSDEDPTIKDMPLPPPLRRMSSSSSSLGEELDSSPAVACTKPSLGFLSRPRVHFCDGDIQADAMEMRQLVIESMRRQQRIIERRNRSKCFHPINI